MTGIEEAIDNQDTLKIALLLENADTDDASQALLYVCSTHPHLLHIVSLLLDYGADVNAVDTYTKWGSLHFACNDDHVECAKLLIANGADVNLKGSDNWTPLHHSCNNSNSECTQLLISHNANLEAREWYGKTPLHFACHAGSLECVKMLVEEGADIHAKGNNDWTPMHYARDRNRNEVIEFLRDIYKRESQS